MMRALLKEFAGSNKRFERKKEGRPIFLKRKSKKIQATVGLVKSTLVFEILLGKPNKNHCSGDS
ncbi:hypothetical protein P0E20_003529 [Vibrio harveyi]|uniref:hypothetical protein n=1 Tax=Vibrio harveyi TaxID=669 RepID=UPI0009385A8A|nr:hypothetical protein [Vibrio harveyi]APP08153.1 hypothetical protein BG259_23140 [Vibrio harveyi]EKO3869549.1 hypothetical protein [Vibrio harveyi]